MNLYCFSLLGQEKNHTLDSLGTEEITVIKSYKPNVLDAVKFNDTPETDNDFLKKINIQCSIFSIPVASTFTPEIKKAQMIRKSYKETIFNNYLEVGFGNYNTPIINSYIESPIKNGEIGGNLNFKSSSRGIKGIKIDNTYIKSKLNLFYIQKDKYFDWKINSGTSFDSFHWYGINPKGIKYSEKQLEQIDTRENYTDIYIDGSIFLYDSAFKEAKARINYLFDVFNNYEINFAFQPKFEFKIGLEKAQLKADINYTANTFKAIDNFNSKIENTYINAGIIPSLVINRNKLSINLGAGVYCISNVKSSDSNLIVYPDIYVSFNLLSNSLVLIGGTKGNIKQYTYESLKNKNPFIAPIINLKTNFSPYNYYLGLIGKINTNIYYNIKASYSKEESYALFKHLSGDSFKENIPGYRLGNSFKVVYDNFTHIELNLNLQYTVFNNLNISSDFTYNKYNTEYQQYAWNLPNVKGFIKVNYEGLKYFADLKIFYIGKRKDISALENIETIIINNAFFDLNLKNSFHLSKKLSVFVELNNILGTNYNYYTFYPVQGFQILAGLNFKFS